MKDKSAFPNVNQEFKNTGLTIRQYYAAKAMQGILANYYAEMSINEITEQSFKIADAMLEAEKELSTNKAE